MNDNKQQNPEIKDGESRQVEQDVRSKYEPTRKTYKRLIVFTVERTNYPGESLIHELPHALREYADACEREELKHQGDVRKFYSSNRCIVKAIYGSHDFYPNEIPDESGGNDDQ